jgi:hypothetical protein
VAIMDSGILYTISGTILTLIALGCVFLVVSESHIEGSVETHCIENGFDGHYWYVDKSLPTTEKGFIRCYNEVYINHELQYKYTIIKDERPVFYDDEGFHLCNSWRITTDNANYTNN